MIGRVLIAAVFLMTVWTGGPAAAYLKSLNYPLPDFMSILAHVVEWIVVLSLVLGIGTRYGALLGLAFVVIAFATAHRYWEFPQAAQNLQYAFLSKDLAIAGGLLVLFVTKALGLAVPPMLLAQAALRSIGMPFVAVHESVHGPSPTSYRSA